MTLFHACRKGPPSSGFCPISPKPNSPNPDPNPIPNPILNPISNPKHTVTLKLTVNITRNGIRQNGRTQPAVASKRKASAGATMQQCHQFLIYSTSVHVFQLTCPLFRHDDCFHLISNFLDRLQLLGITLLNKIL